MAAQATVRIVFDILPEILTKLGVDADQVVAATAEAIASQASAAAPRLTGTLASSIGASQVGQAHWQVSDNVRYAAYVEYGTAKHGGPQPYMTPAAHNEEPNFMARMQGLIPGA